MKNIIIFCCLVVCFVVIFFINKFIKENKIPEIQEQKEDVIIDYIVNYNDFVKTIRNTNLYDSKKNLIGTISNGTIIELDNEYEIVDGYYKLKNLDYYVNYLDVEPTDKEIFENNEYKTYKNYIVYNESIVTNNNYKLLLNDNAVYEINKQDEYPIIIKNDDKYGIEFNNHLAYINKKDVYEIVERQNTNLNHTEKIAILNYHYTIDINSDEGKECTQVICMSDTQVEEEIKYLYDFNFYTATMEDLYLFLTGKIQLPEKSVVITIDDGWYVSRMITILEKYKKMGTLFLIGSLASPNDYASDYLEIHSHSWNLHTPGVCKGSHGGGLLCLDEKTILEDLRQSRESLNNTEIFCYPFYEYNYQSFELLKLAGFKMALAGGSRKAKIGDDLYIVPRYELSKYTDIETFIKYVN